MAFHGLTNTQSVAAVPYAAKPALNTSQLVGRVVYAPTSTMSLRDSQAAALVPYKLGAQARPKVSQVYASVVYATNLAQEARSRAWAFTLDGHPFYVLDLGDEGTFLYDIDTKQWCQWQTSGYTGWNLRNGTRWGEPERVVGGDTANGIVWEMDPDLTVDEGFKPITHVATGGIMTRERVARSVAALRLAGSMGRLTSDSDTTVLLEFSDDNGQTYPYAYTVNLTSGDFQQVVEWRSLGSFKTPGRVFRVTDVGGMLRIDGADVYVDDWDDEKDQVQQMAGG